jgi:Zn finger protein HypA/HybF involved in hydrogenase expression
MILNTTTEKLNYAFLKDFFDKEDVPAENILNDIVAHFGEFEDGLVKRIKNSLESFLKVTVAESQQIKLSLEKSHSKANKCRKNLNNLLRAINSIEEQSFEINFDQSVIKKAKINLDRIKFVVEITAFQRIIRQFRQII